MSKHNNNNNSSKWVCRFWDTVHHDSLFKSLLEVLPTLDTWSAFHHYLVILSFYLSFLISKPRFSFSTPSFTKQHHHPKYSLLLLNPISKQYNAALVAQHSFLWPCEYHSLFSNMITLIKRHGCIMFTYSYKCYYGS